MKRIITFLLALIICQFVHSQTHLPSYLQDTSLQLYSSLNPSNPDVYLSSGSSTISASSALSSDTDRYGNKNSSFVLSGKSTDILYLTNTKTISATTDSFFLYDGKSFSISLWFYTRKLGDVSLISKDNSYKVVTSSPLQFNLELDNSNKNLAFYLYGRNNGNPILVNYTPKINLWMKIKFGK